MSDFASLAESEPSTSLSLLAGARQGDAVAWERIVRLYGPLVYTWARRRGRQPADAADIVQEVLIDAAKGLNHFASGPASTFRGWLWTITRRRLVDQTRLWSQQPEIQSSQQLEQANLTRVPEAVLQPDDAPPTDANSDRRSILAAAIAGLHRRFSPETLTAFRRTVLDGQDPADVAAELGVSRWTVYKARSRVLQRLRTELDGLLDPP
jgi:RNA polymerase sigma-70 factor (ECF subfamily)